MSGVEQTRQATTDQLSSTRQLLQPDPSIRTADQVETEPDAQNRIGGRSSKVKREDEANAEAEAMQSTNMGVVVAMQVVISWSARK